MPERLMSEDRPIVVTGEALVDLVVASDGDLRGHPGGGPYNVARTIARLAQRVVYLGRISRDPLGDRLRQQLACDGVDLSAAVATDALTTLAMAQVDSAGVARYRFYERETSASGLTVEEARAALPARIGTLYLGTLGLVLEPLATTLETIVSDVDDDTLVALDPNCRPATIADPAAYRARLARLLSRADVVKVSEEDLGWLAPGIEPVDAARRLLVDDDAIALVTLGRAGACVVTRRDCARGDRTCRTSRRHDRRRGCLHGRVLSSLAGRRARPPGPDAPGQSRRRRRLCVSCGRSDLRTPGRGGT